MTPWGWLDNSFHNPSKCLPMSATSALQHLTLTSLRSFSICTARWTTGPRTAYSTFFTLGFMLSTVSTLPRHATPFAAWWDMLLLLLLLSAADILRTDIWNMKERLRSGQKVGAVAAWEQIGSVSAYQLLTGLVCCLSSPLTVVPLARLSCCSYSHPTATPRLPRAPARGWLEFFTNFSPQVSACQVTPSRSVGKKPPKLYIRASFTCTTGMIINDVKSMRQLVWATD